MTRAPRKARAAAKRGTDHFRIATGALGPVPKCDLEIRPLTLLVGRQGTGKSLIAQVLYLFEELPFLMRVAAAERGATKRNSEELFRWVLDRLRSRDRAFATFANKNAQVQWTPSAVADWPAGPPETLEFRAYRATRQITVRGKTRAFLDRLRVTIAAHREQVLHHAVFFPTERMVISQLTSALSGSLLSLPITYTLFSHWLDEHAAPEFAGWPRGRPPAGESRALVERGTAALGGSARKYGEQWKWEFTAEGARSQFDLDMASSGQRANWSLPYIAATLLTIRSTGDIAEGLTLFVEEPEIHLHPAAQREMVHLLVRMVNLGFRVVVTTHSMTVLYALNNLVQASLLGAAEAPGVPSPEIRIAPGDVSVYAFTEGEAPRQLMDVEKAFIDERALGGVGDELSAELNRIAANAPPVEG